MTKSTNPLSQTKLNEAILIITNTESISDNWEERKEGKKKKKTAKTWPGNNFSPCDLHCAIPS